MKNTILLWAICTFSGLGMAVAQTTTTLPLKAKTVTAPQIEANPKPLESNEVLVPVSEASVSEVSPVLPFSRFSVAGLFSPVDFLIPGKLGAAIDYRSERGAPAYEIEYLRGNAGLTSLLNLGGVGDKRISVNRRYYSESSSLTWYYGVSYNAVDVKLGSSYLAALGYNTEYELIELQSLGINVGVGNRWRFGRRFQLGVDWVGWSQPLFVLKKSSPYLDLTAPPNPDQRNYVNDAVNGVIFLPRFSLMKVSLGWAF